MPTTRRPSTPTPDHLREAVEAVAAWHDPGRRRLPFRDGADAWGVLVSEVMSQQTQAERAGERWTALMAAFPTPEAMATADVAEVIAMWAGLGYNRRAVNLHRCAVAITEQHGGRVPDDLDALLALPGIGPYTARAVLAFAHDADVVPVDTNVARVLARLGDAVLDVRTARSWADTAAGWVRGPDLAVALMDLGATVCAARAPRCGVCPAAARCGWAGGPGPDPAGAGAHRARPQGRFEGSARQARGRLVDAMRLGPVTQEEALRLAGDHGVPLLAALVADGLAVEVASGFALPGAGGSAGTTAADGRAATHSEDMP